MKYYFSFPELIKTDTKLLNCPKNFEQISNLLELAQFLTHLRIKFGSPIFVSSAFRSFAVNEAVHGAKNSKHMQGLAADIWPLDFGSVNLTEKLIKMCLELHSLNILSECVVNREKHYIHIAL